MIFTPPVAPCDDELSCASIFFSGFVLALLSMFGSLRDEVLQETLPDGVFNFFFELNALFFFVPMVFMEFIVLR